MKPVRKIYIDSRAGSEDLVSQSALSNLPVELCEFDTDGIPGDVAFTINGPESSLDIGIEVKTVHDFIGSTDTGRLQGVGEKESNRGQLIRMLDYFDITFLIIYGNIFAEAGDNSSPKINYFTNAGLSLLHRISERVRVTEESSGSFKSWLRSLVKKVTLGSSNKACYWKGLYAALSELQLVGINYHLVNDKREVALLIATLYRWGQKNWDQHKLFHSFNEASTPISREHLIPTDDHVTILSAKMISRIARIGYGKGLDIARNYKSPAEMIANIALDPNALVGIKGISGTISHAANRAVNGYENKSESDRLVMDLKRLI